jgi:hypothetical protein
MRSISALDVGDGACSVLRDSLAVRTAVIDCGSSDLGMTHAARTLRRSLSAADLGTLDGLVVTHFDQDHWLGLRELPALLAAGDVPPDLTIHIPHVRLGSGAFPPHAVALITVLGGHPVQALALKSAWKAVTRPVLRGLSRGDTFFLAGREHQVLWPPKALDQDSTRRLDAIVEQIRGLAASLAERGHPVLSHALDAVYSELVPDEASDLPDGPGRSDDAAAARAEEARALPAEDGEDEEADDDAHDEEDADPDHEGDAAAGTSAGAFPEDVVADPEFKKLVQRARAAQNALSLVFHDAERRSLIAFGDAPPQIVAELAQDPAVTAKPAPRARPAGHYDVMLAPHHGSQRPVAGFCAEACVSQGGTRLSLKWKARRRMHAGVHCGECVNTFFAVPAAVYPLT